MMVVKIVLINVFFLLKKCLYRDKNIDGISIVIFSYNRLIQYDALLRSLHQNMLNDKTIYSLVKCSNLGDYNEYSEISKNYDVVMTEEVNFRQDLLNILKRISTKKVFFLVDDKL